MDLFDPRTAVMDPEYSPTHTGEPDFAFAFDDVNFSDRILRIEILGDSIAGGSSSDGGCSSLADWARNRKRRREDFRKENG